MTSKPIQQKELSEQIEALTKITQDLSSKEIDELSIFQKMFLLRALENELSINLISRYLACVHSVLLYSKMLDTLFPLYLGLCAPKDERGQASELASVEEGAKNMIFRLFKPFLTKIPMGKGQVEEQVAILRDVGLSFSVELELLDTQIRSKMSWLEPIQETSDPFSFQLEILNRIKRLFNSEDVSESMEKVKESLRKERARILGSREGGKKGKLTPKKPQIIQATQYLESVDWREFKKQAEDYLCWRDEQGLKKIKSRSTAREHLKKARDEHKKTK